MAPYILPAMLKIKIISSSGGQGLNLAGNEVQTGPSLTEKRYDYVSVLKAALKRYIAEPELDNF